jgi:hypothetical protein
MDVYQTIRKMEAITSDDRVARQLSATYPNVKVFALDDVYV